MNSTEKAQQLKRQLEQQLLSLIDQDYVLYGLPYYSNIGDTLIWEGVLDILRKSPHKCKGVCGWNDYPKQKVEPGRTILIEGGGYFGDVWRFGWNNVLQELSLNKDSRVIILPNTIYYNDPQLLSHDIQLLSQLKHLTICVRDQRSYDFARQHFHNEVLLMPDLAFGINPDYLAQWAKPATKDCLYLKREDKELAQTNITLPPGAEISDWPTMVSKTRKEAAIEKMEHFYHHRLGGRLMRIGMTKLLYDKIYYHIYRKQMTKRGVQFISGYKTIYTTRLHGLILAALLGKETYFIDNSYGKVSALYDTWLKDVDNVHPQ